MNRSGEMQRLAGIGNLHPVVVKLDHHGRSRFSQILMNERVCDQLAHCDFREHLYLSPQRLLDDLVRRHQAVDELHHPLKADGVSLRSQPYRISC